ncbi:MAG: hypothetical protein WCZ90_04850 [Melioribacteraceae bacterium]
MLERIINITPGSDYKNSASKSGHYQRSAAFLSTLQSTLSDTISLSPATAFLSSVHWRLKKLSKENEKYTIAFEFDGFEFTAHVGQPEILVSHSLEYEIRKKVEQLTSRYEAYVQLITSVSDSRDLAGSRTELPALSSLLDDFIEMEELTYNLNADTIEVKKKFSQRKDLLMPEFNYLNSCLVVFLEKYLSIKYNFTAGAQNRNEGLLLRKVQITKL